MNTNANKEQDKKAITPEGGLSEIKVMRTVEGVKQTTLFRRRDGKLTAEKTDDSLREVNCGE